MVDRKKSGREAKLATRVNLVPKLSKRGYLPDARDLCTPAVGV